MCSFISPLTPVARWCKSMLMSPVLVAPPLIVLTKAMLNALPPHGIKDVMVLEQLSGETILANLKCCFNSKLIYVCFTTSLLHFSLSMMMQAKQALTGVGQ